MLKPFQKSHNTAFRLLSVLLYGPEAQLPYLRLIYRSEDVQILELRSGPASLKLNMTIPRLKEHLLWLESIGLVYSVYQPQRGLLRVSVKLPKHTPYEAPNEP